MWNVTKWLIFRNPVTTWKYSGNYCVVPFNQQGSDLRFSNVSICIWSSLTKMTAILEYICPESYTRFISSKVFIAHRMNTQKTLLLSANLRVLASARLSLSSTVAFALTQRHAPPSIWKVNKYKGNFYDSLSFVLGHYHIRLNWMLQKKCMYLLIFLYS